MPWPISQILFVDDWAIKIRKENFAASFLNDSDVIENEEEFCRGNSEFEGHFVAIISFCNQS